MQALPAMALPDRHPPHQLAGEVSAFASGGSTNRLTTRPDRRPQPLPAPPGSARPVPRPQPRPQRSFATEQVVDIVVDMNGIANRNVIHAKPAHPFPPPAAARNGLRIARGKIV